MARLIDGLRGHESVWRRLLDSLGRGRLPHALAFSGPSGVGKRQMAWALAQALVCEREERPCGECGPCRRVANRQSESVLALAPTGNLIKLETAAQALEFLSLQSLGRARVVLIDSAQLLNPQAANSLLKVIEEPPPGAYFILITPEISQLLPTLRSRVQNVRFAPLKASELGEILQEDRPKWMLASARGSLERLEQLSGEDEGSLRARALGFLSGAGTHDRAALDGVLSEMRDKDAGLRLARLFQQLLRDWTLLDAEEPIHADLAKELRRLPPVETARRLELWRAAFQLEADILGNVDRTLLTENFYYRAGRVMR